MTGMGLWAVRQDVLQQSFAQVAALRDLDKGVINGRRGAKLSNEVFSFATRVGSTAIVPVLGPIMSRQNFFFWSYDEIIRDVELAVADETIERIMLDIDSPGGMVAGCDDCATALRVAGLEKPLSAHTGGLMASAAYWLASAASEIVASRSATIGSIGAIIRYIDIEGIIKKAGGRVIEVVAEQSPMKALDPESKAGQAELQALVDGAAELFIDAVAENRGENSDFIQRRYGAGLVFKAGEAKSRTMIDQLAGFDEYLADLAARESNAIEGPNSATAPEAEESKMNYAELTLAGLREHRPDLLNEAEGAARAPIAAERDAAMAERDGAAADHAAAITAATEAGQTGERERIAAIIAAGDKTGQDAIVAKCIEAGTSVADATAQILAAVKTDANSPLAQLRQTEAASAGEVITPGATDSGASNAAAATGADAWTAEWQASATLKGEFETCEDYVAYRKADAAGSTKILQGRAGA